MTGGDAGGDAVDPNDREATRRRDGETTRGGVSVAVGGGVKDGGGGVTGTCIMPAGVGEVPDLRKDSFLIISSYIIISGKNSHSQKGSE